MQPGSFLSTRNTDVRYIKLVTESDKVLFYFILLFSIRIYFLTLFMERGDLVLMIEKCNPFLPSLSTQSWPRGYGKTSLEKYLKSEQILCIFKIRFAWPSIALQISLLRFNAGTFLLKIINELRNFLCDFDKNFLPN